MTPQVVVERWENVQAKHLDQHDLCTVAEIVGPDDLGPQVKNEVVCHHAETTCFDAHAVRLQGIASMQHV